MSSAESVEDMLCDISYCDVRSKKPGELIKNSVFCHGDSTISMVLPSTVKGTTYTVTRRSSD